MRNGRLTGTAKHEGSDTMNTIWHDAVVALDDAETALAEALRSSHPSRQQVARAIEARDAAQQRKEAARVLIIAAMEAEDRAEEAAAVAAAIAIINGR